MKSDTILKQSILEELKWEPSLNASSIAVNVDRGVVTLTGTVPHYADKWTAERATQRVEGIKAIAEEIQVSLSVVHQRTDEDLAHTAVAALQYHVWVPRDVQPTIENGWITLKGQANWGFQRDAAEDAVAYLAGVKGVTNNISIMPSVQPHAIKEAIDTALQRDAHIDAANIIVLTDGGKVTLSGNVTSWNQREQAESAAWRAPGVTDVVNTLAVSN
jgi:osmotically-inducible protein OsmY